MFAIIRVHPARGCQTLSPHSVDTHQIWKWENRRGRRRVCFVRSFCDTVYGARVERDCIPPFHRRADNPTNLKCNSDCILRARVPARISRVFVLTDRTTAQSAKPRGLLSMQIKQTQRSAGERGLRMKEKQKAQQSFTDY